MIKPKTPTPKPKGSATQPKRQLWHAHKSSPIKTWIELWKGLKVRNLTPEEKGALAYFTKNFSD